MRQKPSVLALDGVLRCLAGGMGMGEGWDFTMMHCLKNRPHFTFYTAEATNAILYWALRRYDVKLREETA
jgi:hypothetical protein